MSKERLEEFKKQIDFLDDSADMEDFGRFVDTIQNMYEDGEFHWIVRYLKEQAERVEESERQMFTMVENTEKLKSMLNFKIKLLEKQNKRYRDVIEIAIHNMKGCSDLGTVFALNELERVLEDAE